MVDTRNNKEKPTNNNTPNKNSTGQVITIKVEELTKIIENVVNVKILSLQNEITALRESNIELVRLLTKNIGIKKNLDNENTFPHINTSEPCDNQTNQHPKNRNTVEGLLYPKTKKTNNTQPKHKSKTQSQSRQIIKGNSETDTQNEIAAAPKKLWIYVGKLAAGTSSESLKKYLERKIPNRHFIIDNLRNDATSSSFRVGADIDLQETLYSPEFWPTKVVVKRFLFRKPRRQPSTSH